VTLHCHCFFLLFFCIVSLLCWLYSASTRGEVRFSVLENDAHLRKLCNAIYLFIAHARTHSYVATRWAMDRLKASARGGFYSCKRLLTGIKPKFHFLTYSTVTAKILHWTPLYSKCCTCEQTRHRNMLQIASESAAAAAVAVARV